MRKEHTALHLKERAIIAAFDELSVIRTTGNLDAGTLHTVLSALCSYPASKEAKHLSRNHYNTVADHCVNVVDNLLRLCLLGQAPAFALHTIDETLSIALGHIQTAITHYAKSN